METHFQDFSESSFHFMETVLSQNRINMKGNKENSQPFHGSKSVLHKNKAPAVPFQVKIKKTQKIQISGSLSKLSNKPDANPALRETVKKVQKDGKGVKPQSQMSFTQQAAKPITAIEAPKLSATVQSSKSAPGMYKGRIVQSKIGSIWKSSDTLCTTQSKSEGQRVTNMSTKKHFRPVCKMPGPGIKKPVLQRCSSVAEKPAQEGKAASRFSSTRPTVRAALATLGTSKPRTTTVGPVRMTGSQEAKPKVPVPDKKVKKPAASSSLSQYRLNVETTEERKAKLAEWLASKGKTFKRPAMTAHSKHQITAKTTNKKTHPKVHPAVELRSATEKKTVAVQNQEVAHLDYEAPVHGGKNSSNLMNTSLDLLESSDTDLDVLQDRVDDIVVNLCDALEAMVTPTMCPDEIGQIKTECDVDQEGDKPAVEYKEEDLDSLKSERTSEEQSDKAEDVDTDRDEMETTPEPRGTSVKYSVKTTPYLQSVKKTIEDDVETSASRRKSNIKDLKFLTPVRRSCRIQRKSSYLPPMLVDHDPCVSSLAELVKLDDDPNAYIYRKNPALLQELPDQKLQ